jgi:hypothetical protein
LNLSTLVPERIRYTIFDDAKFESEDFAFRASSTALNGLAGSKGLRCLSGAERQCLVGREFRGEAGVDGSALTTNNEETKKDSYISRTGLSSRTMYRARPLSPERSLRHAAAAFGTAMQLVVGSYLGFRSLRPFGRHSVGEVGKILEMPRFGPAT